MTMTIPQDSRQRTEPDSLPSRLEDRIRVLVPEGESYSIAVQLEAGISPQQREAIARTLGQYGDVLPYRPWARSLNFRPSAEDKIREFQAAFDSGELEGIIDFEVDTKLVHLLNSYASSYSINK